MITIFSKKTFGMYLNGGMYLLLWKVSWCTQPLWCPCGTLAHWFGTLTHWYCCARNPCGTLVLWYNRAILHWHSLALVYWYTAPVVHCAQCAMVHLYTLAHSFGTLCTQPLWCSCNRKSHHAPSDTIIIVVTSIVIIIVIIIIVIIIIVITINLSLGSTV